MASICQAPSVGSVIEVRRRASAQWLTKITLLFREQSDIISQGAFPDLTSMIAFIDTVVNNLVNPPYIKCSPEPRCLWSLMSTSPS